MLYSQVLEMHSTSLDKRHPDRLKSAKDVEAVKSFLAEPLLPLR